MPERDFKHDKAQAKKVFDEYAINGAIGYNELQEFISSLFESKVHSEDNVNDDVDDICEELTNGNKHIEFDKQQFIDLYTKFVNGVCSPVSAFIVVDVQNDFISGSLALSNCPAQEDGAEVVPVINDVLENCTFDHVFYTYDWHPCDHISFHDNLHIHKENLIDVPEPHNLQIMETVKFCCRPDNASACIQLDQTLWPRHCVQGSDGAKLHKDLIVVPNHKAIYKGQNKEVDSYSAFWDNGEFNATDLRRELEEREVQDVYICGLATDICVYFTARHACKHNYRTYFVLDACRGVDKDAIDRALADLRGLGAIIIQSSDVKDFLTGVKCSSKLAKVAAKNYKRSTFA